MRLQKKLMTVGFIVVAGLVVSSSYFAFAQQCRQGYRSCGNNPDWCCLDEYFCVDPIPQYCEYVGDEEVKCPSTVIYGVDSEEAELLRKFRDGILSKTPTGREIIRLYYKWSPVIVSAIEEDQEFKEELKELIDEMLPMIEEVVE